MQSISLGHVQNFVICYTRPGLSKCAGAITAPLSFATSDMCSPTWETHIPSEMFSPTWETHIPSEMCSPTWETHIPSEMCSPTWETHIPSDISHLGNTCLLLSVIFLLPEIFLTTFQDGFEFWLTGLQ